MGTTVGPREFTFAALGDTGPSETPVSTCGHALSHMSRQEAHECLTATLDPKNTCSPGKKGPAQGPRRAGVVGVSASIQSPRPPVIIAELSTSQDTTERPGHRMHSLALITTTVQRKELTPQSWTDGPKSKRHTVFRDSLYPCNTSSSWAPATTPRERRCTGFLDSGGHAPARER